MEYPKEEIKRRLHDLLDECLEGLNQEGSFEIKKIDLEKRKCTVEFDIIINKEDDYVGFAGY